MSNNGEKGEAEELADEYIDKLANYIQALNQKWFFERNRERIEDSERRRELIKNAEQLVQVTRAELKELMKKIIKRS